MVTSAMHLAVMLTFRLYRGFTYVLSDEDGKMCIFTLAKQNGLYAFNIKHKESTIKQ